MQQRGDAVGGVVHEPVLYGGSAVTQLVRVSGLLHAELREVSDAVGNQLAALGRVEFPLLIKEVIHVHTLQLGNALLLRHPVVEFIHFLFHVCCCATTCQQCSQARKCQTAEAGYLFPNIVNHVLCY